MCDKFLHFSDHKPVYKLKNELKQFLEFPVLYGSSVRLFLLYCILYMPRRKRIPIEHREGIVRAFEDEAEDYLLLADTSGVNRFTAREIVARYIREGRIRERPLGGRNNVLVDDEMRQCLEEIIDENCVLTLSQINGKLRRETSGQTSNSWPKHSSKFWRNAASR